MKKIIYIEGMACEKCKERVENALNENDAVEDAKVDLTEKKAEVLLDKKIKDEELKGIVEDLGYTVIKIEVE